MLLKGHYTYRPGIITSGIANKPLAIGSWPSARSLHSRRGRAFAGCAVADEGTLAASLRGIMAASIMGFAASRFVSGSGARAGCAAGLGEGASGSGSDSDSNSGTLRTISP